MRSRLRIVAVNDVYLLDNLPRLASLVRHHAEHDPADRMIVVMAGDFVAPSVLSSLDGGRGMVDCMNHVPFTHVILGNHEDDVELPDLRARLRELHATVLLSNVRDVDETHPVAAVLEVGEARVGLLGLTDGDPMLYRRPPFGGARIGDVNETALRMAKMLRASGCDAVIPITHQRADDDRDLARSDAGFPLVLGGHEHDGILEQHGQTWLAKAPAEATSAIVADLVLEKGSLPSLSIRFDAVADYPEDAAMRARVDGHLEKVRELEDATLLFLPEGEELSSVGTRAQQTSMGTLVCSRLRDALGAEAAVFNGGGIRGARRYTRRLSYRDVMTELPFDNELVVVPVPGRVLADAIAYSRRKAPVEAPSFLQLGDGMRLEDGALVEVAGAPLDPHRHYRVALVRNLFEGMDDIAPFVEFARANPRAIPEPTTGREVKVVLLSAFAPMLFAQLGGLAAVDADGDGAASLDELTHALSLAAGKAGSVVAARVVLDALDANRDRLLTADEVG